jgi:hypothetical protein
MNVEKLTFTQELQKRGAREFQIAALSADEPRALAAIAETERRGIEHVVAYAMTLFDDPEWVPRGKKAVALTNLSVDRNCPRCGGDRFVPVTDSVTALYGETYAPCAACNGSTNASFYRGNGDLVKVVPR